MGKKTENIDILLFKKQYEEELLTLPQLSKLYNISYSTARRFAIENGINLRHKGNVEGKEYHREPKNKQHIIGDNEEHLIVMFNNLEPISNIAIKLGVSRKAVDRKVKELGLIRPKSMMSRSQYDNSIDKKIIQMYENGKSTTEISKEVNLTHKTILSHLKHNGIKIRSLSESHFNYNNKEIPKELLDYDILYDLYVTQRMSKKKISELLNVSPNVVNRVLKNFNIKIRDASESKIGLMVGNKHPNWKGGITSLYALLREYFAVHQQKLILKRDNFTCQMCGSKNNLHVHHIVPFKEIIDTILHENEELTIESNKEELFKIIINDKRMNDLDNLITYCRDCHLFEVHGYQKNI